jgi:putative tryptophan/tyrosine transport system substrate-binding protein
MNRRTFVASVAAGFMVQPYRVVAQQASKIWRVGMLETTSAALNAANLDAFRQGLRELGYIEGRNLSIEYRSADGRGERFAELAAELVSLKVDLILARGTPAALAAKKATRSIPVVIVSIADPLQVVASLAHPGGNITGLSNQTPDFEAKRLELLRALVPQVARVAMLYNMSNPYYPARWAEMEVTAKSLGIQAQLLDARNPEDLERVFDAASSQHADGLIVAADGLFQGNRKRISELAATHRLPAIYQSREFVQAGGLIAYGPSYPDLYRRATTYIDKILKGANPGDLPIEQPTKFGLVINLKTAEALRLTIPQSLLLRADEVIQ